jgi:hypothetical protein
MSAAASSVLGSINVQFCNLPFPRISISSLSCFITSIQVCRSHSMVLRC